MMKSKVKCPVCSIEGEARSQEDINQIFMDCPRCGKFILDRSALEYIERNGADGLMSAWIRERQDNSLKYLLFVTGDELETFMKNLPSFSIARKQILLLRYLESKSDHAGAYVEIDPEYDYPLVWAKNKEECVYLIKTLIQRKLVVVSDEEMVDLSYHLAISPDGWDYLDRHASDRTFTDQVFVAMSFSPALTDIYEKGIKPAIEEAGYKAYRIDKDTHADRIDSKIMTEILNSHFIIADVTEQKQGVYFEAGFAMGNNRPVLWSVREDELKKVHFDTRQYNHIVWKDADDLKTKLYYFIAGIIGKKHKKA